MKKHKPKICFVGLDNYPVLNPCMGHKYIGGESVQQTLLAKAFTKLGFQVSMVVKDYGQCDGEIIDDIKIWKTYKHGAGLPVLRFIHPNVTSMIFALNKADADIYYQSCAGMLTGLVGWFCKKNNKRFVFRTASDTDCIAGQQLITYWRDRKIYEYGLKRANVIAVQGVKQQSLLRENYALESVPVNMAVEMPEEELGDSRDIDVLWVNNIRPLKQPELLIELATMVPNRQFVMIGGPCANGESYYDEVAKRARDVGNLDFLGFVPYSEVNSYFARAKVFINTSEVEGFPNSFLQAWIREVPTVSFFDPDDIIKNHGLGAVPSEIIEMAENIDQLLTNTERRESIGEKARAFATDYYSPVSVARTYMDLLENNK